MEIRTKYHLIQIASYFPDFPMFWNVENYVRWDFAQTVWWYCAFAHL